MTFKRETKFLGGCFILVGTLLHAASAAAAPTYYVDLSLVGSELDGPKPTEDWDLGLYRGISINPAVGLRYDIDEVDLSLQLELFDHSSSSMGHDSKLSVDGSLFKLIVGVTVIEEWRLFFGIGRGHASVVMDNSACLTYSGCGFSPYQYPQVSGSSSLSATLFGVGWEYSAGREAYAGFQTVKSGGLGFRDVYGTPYATDRLDLPTSFIGIRFLF